MNREEFRHQVTKFMADNQFDPLLDMLCSAEVIRKIGKETFDDVNKRINIFLANAPEDLEEQVEEALTELDEYSFEKYMDDFRINFAVFEYIAIQPALELSDEIIYKDFICFAAREAITLDNPKVTEKSIEIFKRLANALFDGIISIAFDGYIPEGIPSEVAQIIRDIAGNGVIIPGDSFMEFLDEMAEEDYDGEDEDESGSFRASGEYTS